MTGTGRPWDWSMDGWEYAWARHGVTAANPAKSGSGNASGSDDPDNSNGSKKDRSAVAQVDRGAEGARGFKQAIRPGSGMPHGVSLRRVNVS